MGVTAAACVGDDQAAGPSTEDGGSDVNVPPGDDGSDAGPSTPPPDKDAGHDAGVDAADAAPPIAPPIVSPNAWLDARTLTEKTLTTWPDVTPNGADAVGSIAHTVDAKALGGMPGILFTGEEAQSFDIAAAKLKGFRVYDAGHGFTVFVVALHRDGVAARSSQAVLFARRKFEGYPTHRLGTELSLNAALTTATGHLWSYSASQLDTSASGSAPSKDAPHLYVFQGQDNTATLRIDGALVQSTPGFTEHDFTYNKDEAFSIGAYDQGAPFAQFGWVGAIGMVAIYTRAISDTDLQAGEQAAMKAWGIP